MQAAYGLLDKYKISRSFFVKTDQTNCETTAEPDEAIDAPDTGYDIVVDDDTVSSELLNHHGYDNPQINQVQHIAHVQNLQQFSPYIQPQQHIPQIHHVHGVGVYYKQKENPAEKSALNITAEKQKDSIPSEKSVLDATTAKEKAEITENTKMADEKLTTEAKMLTEQSTTVTSEFKEKIQSTTLPIPLLLSTTMKEANATKDETKTILDKKI